MNYDDGKIYKIWNEENDLLYIGSTARPLHKRMYDHRINAKKGSNYRLHQAMRELGCECFHIELIKEYPCENRQQLRRKEGHYIRKYETHKNGYNKCVAGRTPQETDHAKYEKNCEKVKARTKVFYEAHKDERKAYNVAYREANKEKLREYQKAYREAHNDTQKEYMKAYYEAHKDEKKQKIKEKGICSVCDQEMRKDSIPRHMKAKHPED